jgi:hypothetical protein
MWIPTDTNYFFQYSRTDSAGNIITIPQASLPIYWNTAGDWADSIRFVQMRIAGLYRDVRKAKDITKTIYHSTRLLNAGMLKQNTCGAAPLAAASVVDSLLDGGSPTSLPAILPGPWTTTDTLPPVEVRVVFTASPEEAGGAKDVASYVIQRTLHGTTNWQVLGNLVANGSASYVWDDYTFVTGVWDYGVVAVDCSPSYSPVKLNLASVTNP